MGGKKLDNNGFSLLELIVAVIILGILSAGVLAAFSTVHNAKVDSATSKLMNAMKQARMKAMSVVNSTFRPDMDTAESLTNFERSQVYVKLYKKGDGFFADVCYDEFTVDDDSKEATVTDTKALTSEKLSNDLVTYCLKSHSDTSLSKMLGAGTSKVIRIYYKKNTGGIKCITISDNDAEDGTRAVESLLPESDGYDNIYIEGKSKDVDQTVVIVKPTGRTFKLKDEAEDEENPG